MQAKISKRQRRLRWKRWQQSEEAKSDNKQRIELTPEESAEVRKGIIALELRSVTAPYNLGSGYFVASGETQRITEAPCQCSG